MRQPILTPDRRLRVFVSSTLRELAVERTAAREAISSLRLAPILFEQGARPHAPRDLYSAYVDQCDVFVAIYWQSYGWVAPDAEISGLEDELNLAQGKPMLLYVKEPAPEREERLAAMIARIEAGVGSSYRPFATGEELRTLVTDDLAVLLTERFHAQDGGDAGDEEWSVPGVPARTTSFVGRDRELDDLLRLVDRDDVRLVTLTGPGGIGKTRLAVEAARRVAARFPDGVAFVPLDGLTDPELVPAAIGDAVGLSSLGPDPAAGLARRLGQRRVLLVLDNFEHVLDAAPLVTRLLESCAELEVLATSREPLRLQGEHEYPVPPLADAARLFVERVEAVRPDVVWGEAELGAADEVCRRVEGLPLAVELVAAAARTLSPQALVAHLGSSLDAPSSGRRDAPARQQTVRATIDWSYGLLAEAERDLFERLGVFAGSFTIEAARAVSAETGSAVLRTLAALADKSLLVHSAAETETRFRMLQAVSEYAAERLAERADADDVRGAHASYYHEFARAAHAGLRGRGQRSWKESLDLESENVRAALAHLGRTGRVDAAAEVVWGVWVYWLTGHFLEGRKRAAELLRSNGLSPSWRARMQTVDGGLAALLGDLPTAHAELADALAWAGAHDDREVSANALCGLGIATAPVDAERARDLLLDGARLFAAIADPWGEALSLGALGWLDVGRGDISEGALFERAYDLAREVEDEVTTAHTATNLAELRLAQGRLDGAIAALDVALRAHAAVRLYDGLSYGLEAAAGLAVHKQQPDEAARLLGAADWLRAEVGVPIWGPRRTRSEALVESVRGALGSEAFDRCWADGRALGFDGALRAASRLVDGERVGVDS
jgi:predicted ATPase